MPNWCANRLMFSGIQNSDALKTWIAGGGLSLHRRARKDGIQLFLAGCAGILRPLTELCYTPYPQLVAHGMAADNRASAQAYSDWLAMFMAGAVLDVETCQTLHQCWLDSHIGHARWATLSEPEQVVIRQLYQQKSFDWGNSFRPAPVEEWWNSLCDAGDDLFAAEPVDLRDVLPTRLDIEVNGFNGGLLTGVPSSYDHYLTRYGCKWPVGYESNICFAGENTLTVDFDTPWSPVGEVVVAELSQRYGGEVEHWFAEQGCNYCGYARYVS
ncbi:DUF1281 domain-containing protein, partial [Citrobacter portucalensis]